MNELKLIDNFNPEAYYSTRSSYLFWEKFKGNTGLIKRLECARIENDQLVYGIHKKEEKQRR